MLAIPRSLFRRMGVVLRKCFRKANGNLPGVALHAGAEELRVRAISPDVAVEFRQPGAFAPADFVLPFEALAGFEGRDDSAVSFESAPDNKVRASWVDAGVPQQIESGQPDRATGPVMPGPPGRLRPIRHGCCRRWPPRRSAWRPIRRGMRSTASSCAAAAR